VGVRGRFAAVLLTMAAGAWAAPARAEQNFTGLASAHMGSVNGGDVREGGLTVAGSMAVVEDNGLGAELDLGHTQRFDDGLFDESSVSTLMLNFAAVWPHPNIRPFGTGGAGVLRARASGTEGEVRTRTDAAFNVGGGLLYMFNDVFGVRGELRYFRYFDRHDDLRRADDGHFDFWRTTVGATLAWPIR